MTALRSFAFNVAFYVNLIVLMIIGLPLVLLGHHGVFFMARLWSASSLWLLEKLCGLKVEFRGVENVPPGGYILAAKHQSFLETFALLGHARDFAIIFKRQLVWIPLFGLYLVGARQIAIDRSHGRAALSQIIAQARDVLGAGRQIMIYPEGTRRPPGAPPRYKYGVAAIYAGNSAPCVPVALNTGLYWGRRDSTRRPGVAVIEYLPPIPPGLDRDAFFRRLESAMEEASARLNEEAVAADPRLAPVLAAGKATVDGPRAGHERHEA
jgi:1-acyl-sn-glycerol-3-phosphate acyltransferase